MKKTIVVNGEEHEVAEKGTPVFNTIDSYLAKKGLTRKDVEKEPTK